MTTKVRKILTKDDLKMCSPFEIPFDFRQALNLNRVFLKLNKQNPPSSRVDNYYAVNVKGK